MPTMKPLLVVKLGTAALTDANHEVHAPTILEVVRQLVQLHQDYRIIMVSSGAVGSGKKHLKNYRGTVNQRKAAAAIGNPLLMAQYANAFGAYKITVAQALCERQHFSDRPKFLELRTTFEELWKNNVIPIANENDVTSSTELTFSDNDELAMMLAVGFCAQKLLLGSSVAGVLDAKGNVVSRIDSFDQSVHNLARPEISSGGFGGMISKLNSADMATRFGVETIIFNAKEPGAILDAMSGTTGTNCKPQDNSASSHQRWLGASSLVLGKIFVDAGAAKAVRNRKSLLSVGVTNIEGLFPYSSTVEIWEDGAEKAFAIAQTSENAELIRQSITNKKSIEVAHADKIVIL